MRPAHPVLAPLLALGLALAAAPASLADTAAPQSRAEITLSFAPLVREVAPAVVNIYARRVTTERASPFSDDPFFRDFFRDFGPARPRVQNSLGSGVVLSPDGLIVSNYHVVAGASDIRVVLTDRREFSADVVLTDQASDLVILRLDGADDLQVVPFRDSDSVEVGELALAIGNPFGVGQTVSSGIISGLARAGFAPGGAGRGYFIQTDAAINPGNSGGALIDVQGRLVGVNTAILSRSGGSHGIGFAIPANLVREVLRQAEAGAARFARPWAGLGGQAVDGDLADSLGLDIPEGVVIAEIHPDSPFEAAGFVVGDVITAVDGLPVNSGQEVEFRMSVAGLDREAAVTRLRGGRAETVPVAMIPPPENPARDRRVLGDRNVLAGLVVLTVNPAVITEYLLPMSLQGAMVEDPGRIGARVGLRPGDVISAVNGQPVANSAEVETALAASGRNLALDILRAGQRVSLRARI